MTLSPDYIIYKEFIDKFLPQEFMGISRLDPFIIAMEESMRSNNQFFYIADLLKINILFTSWGSQKIIGVSPEQVDTSTFFVLAHPEDQERLNQAQAKLFQHGQELFIQRKGISIVSVAIRERNGAGIYVDIILQAYSFFSEIHKTVFTMILATEICLPKISTSIRGYFYTGNNMQMFRYPDEAFILKKGREGNEFSKREFEIISLIAAGMGSEQIADKLFLSVTTVSTHRRNILKKTRRSSTHELVIELQQRGIL